MAEEAKKKPDSPAPAEKKEGAASAPSGGLLSKTPVLLGAAMLIEAVVLFAGFKFLGGGPKQSQAVELAAAAQASDKTDGGDKGAAATPDKKSPVEIPVVDFRAPNKQTGRTYLYDVSIYVVTKQENADMVKALITSRSELIQDRIRTIIAQSDPDKLGGGSEPGLETLRRQIKYQLDQIVGDGLIDEVLIPRCIPYRADF